MNRMVLVALACGLVAPLAHVGCSGDSGPSTPTGATRAPLTVTALAVAGCLAADNYQCRAMASMSNATTQNVTSQAQWSTSDPAIATISSTGLVTLVASGNVQLRASYQTLSATRDIATTVTPAARFFALTGLVTTVSGQPISGATVDASLMRRDGASALDRWWRFYHAAPLREGAVTVVASATGYQSVTRSVALTQDLRWSDLQLPATLTPTPPPSVGATSCSGVPSRAGCGVPTAQCNNGQWSCSQKPLGHVLVEWRSVVLGVPGAAVLAVGPALVRTLLLSGSG